VPEVRALGGDRRAAARQWRPAGLLWRHAQRNAAEPSARHRLVHSGKSAWCPVSEALLICLASISSPSNTGLWIVGSPRWRRASTRGWTLSLPIRTEPACRGRPRGHHGRGDGGRRLVAEGRLCAAPKAAAPSIAASDACASTSCRARAIAPRHGLIALDL